MTTVRQLLQQKGSAIHSIAPEATVYDAIAKMAERNIGSLLVMSGPKLVGSSPSDIIRGKSRCAARARRRPR